MKHYTMEEYLKMLANARKWRLDQGYSLNDFAKILGYSKSNISMFEHGKSNNSLILATYILNGFNPLKEGE